MANALKGILIGGAVGAVTALLVTPKTGKEMRETLRQKSSELTSAARDRASTLTSQAKDKAIEARDQLNELGQAASDKMSAVAETASGVFQQMKQENQDNRDKTDNANEKAGSRFNSGDSYKTAAPSHV